MSFLCVLPGFSKPSAQQVLEKSRASFDRGHYSEALKSLYMLNIKSDLDNSDDMKLAFKIKAIAHHALHEEEKSKEAIRELLFMDPDYQFNPFDTPEALVILAKAEQKAIEKKNEHLALVRENNLEVAIKDSFMPKDNFLTPKPKLVSTLFPFGINHFYQSSPVKGGVYLGLESLGIALNIGAFWWKQSYLTRFGEPKLQDMSNLKHFETAQVIQYVALGSTLLFYVISVIDAFINIDDNNFRTKQLVTKL